MVAGYFTPGEGEQFQYEDLQRRKRLAEALMQQAGDYSPVQSWTQGVARLTSGLVGGMQNDYANKLNKQAGAAYDEKISPIAKALMGGSPSTAPSTSVNSAPGPLASAVGGSPAPTAGPAANMPGDMSTWAAAIKKKESAGSGDYAAVGPTHPKLGRALGAYQVMEANIGPWSREALGREVTPDEFMKNPQIQDQIFQHKFGQYVQKFGNPQDAASAWFTGRPQSQGANARDVLGTTGSAYVQDFNRNIGQPVQMAQAGGPVASDAPPMAYAPGAGTGSAPPQTGPMPPPAPRGQQLAQAVAPTSPAIPQPQPTGNVNAALYEIMRDNRFSPEQKRQALQMFEMQQNQNKATYQTDADGNIIQLDPSGRRPPQVVYRGAVKPTIIPEAGRAVIPDPNAPGGYREIAGSAQQQDFIETADGRRIPVPAGLDRKGREAFKAEFAKSDAQTLQNAPGAFSNLQETQKNIAGVMANVPGLKQITGPAGSVLELIPGSDARATKARVNQLLGDTFLAAFESLKGGGQITEVEGKKAQQAKARLDDPRIGFNEYVAALKDFHDAVYSGMEKLKKLPGMEKMQLPPRIDFRVGTQAPAKAPGAVGTAPTPPPAGVDGNVWKYMTPEERALWN